MISMSLRSFKIQSYYLRGILLLGWMVTPSSSHFLGS
ncbi:ATP synthase subunit I, partial [Klebsiella pneumoniae]|nr:ATP synthase subunit I [Klebsiella pneumoniae]